MIRNKRTIMAVAGIQVLFFHLWIALFPKNATELFLKRSAFMGVDLFFLVSAWSLGARRITDPKAFLRSRFEAVYVKYALFVLIAAVLGNWSLQRIGSVTLGIELWQKGGGAFLWFVPAILLFYLLALLCQRGTEKHGSWFLLFVLGVWFAIGLIVDRHTSYTAMFIFFNRIPIFLLGYACGRSKLSKSVQSTRFCLSLGVPLVCVGVVLAVLCIQPTFLQVPFRDFFYVGMIPLCFGLALVLSCVCETEWIKRIGSSTLEMYGVQMVFGYGFASKVLALSQSALCTNVCTFGFVCGLSVLISSLARRGIIDKRMR